jgi:hypothetical protein
MCKHDQHPELGMPPFHAIPCIQRWRYDVVSENLGNADRKWVQVGEWVFSASWAHSQHAADRRAVPQETANATPKPTHSERMRPTVTWAHVQARHLTICSAIPPAPWLHAAAEARPFGTAA